MDQPRQVSTAVEPLLEAELSADYPGRPGVLDRVRFTVQSGEILGLIGRSGSGKSTLGWALPRLLELRGGRVRGTLRFAGRDLLSADSATLRQVRGRELAFVPQSPMCALNPALSIGTHLREAWRAHSSESWTAARDRFVPLLESMALPLADSFLRRRPGQLSVGQAQRVTVAMAVLHNPKLLIADEVTSALDPASQGLILDLFRHWNISLGMAILFISHDMASVARLCRRVALLEAGRLIETLPGEAFSVTNSDAFATCAELTDVRAR